MGTIRAQRHPVLLSEVEAAAAGADCGLNGRNVRSEIISEELKLASGLPGMPVILLAAQIHAVECVETAVYWKVVLVTVAEVPS